jgi:hypothetical protein
LIRWSSISTRGVGIGTFCISGFHENRFAVEETSITDTATKYLLFSEALLHEIAKAVSVHIS